MLTVCKGSLPFVLLLAGEPAANVCSMVHGLVQMCAYGAVNSCHLCLFKAWQVEVHAGLRRVEQREQHVLYSI